MSIVPTATERSPWPPGFSLVIIVAQILCGSRFSRAIVDKRLRIGLEEPRHEALADQTTLTVATVGIEAVADHRSPSRMTSVTTATRLSVILEKSMYALRISERIGLVASRMSTIFMVLPEHCTSR